MVKTLFTLALIAVFILGVVSYGRRSTRSKVTESAVAVSDDIKDAAHDAKDAVMDATN